MRSNYWSNSKLADWIRGEKSPVALSAKGWEEFERRNREQRPIRFWIAEDGLDGLQTFLCWPLDKIKDVRYYVNNRWVTKAHALTAHPRDVKPGTWCDYGDRILYCLFNELVDFVEIEKAWMSVISDDQDKYKMPWVYKHVLRRRWRSPNAGLAYLNWEVEETQNESRQEIIDLYLWWKLKRPLRPDPFEASGFLDAVDHVSLEEAASKEHTRECLDKLREMETSYDQEDTEMLNKLISIRHRLWT